MSDHLTTFRLSLAARPALFLLICAAFSVAAAVDDRPDSEPRAIAENVKKALGELNERFILPQTYGRTTVIDGSMDHFELPKGPMEILIQQPISLHMVDADIKELLLALGRIEGLNIIADDSLDTKSKLTLQLRDVPLYEIFSYVSRNMGVDFHIGANTVWVTKATTENSQSGMRLITRVYPLRHGFSPRMTEDSAAAGATSGSAEPSTSMPATGNDLLNALSLFLSGEDTGPTGAKYAFYSDSNTLVVRDRLENLRVVEYLIKSFDRPLLQVLIETRFIRISQSDLFQLSVDINNFTYNDGSRLALVGSSTFARDILEGGELGLSGIISRKQYEIMLKALDSKSSTRTLSAPRITVLNNHSAFLDDSRKEYYFSEYDLETIDLGDAGTSTRLVPVGKPEELDIGISMRVIPSIGNDGRTITLALEPKITGSSEPYGVRTLRDIADTDNETDTDYSEGYVQVPSFYENSLTTSVTLNSGQTVLLGGSMSTQVSKVKTKTPLLGDLPLIGWLFRSEEERSDPENLLIFVTATIIGPDGSFTDTAVTNQPSLP